MADDDLKKDGSYREKPPMHLLDKKALFETARVLGFGATKYSEDGWRDRERYGLGTKRPLAAALRHIFEYLDGKANDDETGLNVLAHVMCEVMFAMRAHFEGKADHIRPGTEEATRTFTVLARRPDSGRS